MFRPLDMVREITQDDQLTSAEKLVLICAVVHTDNLSRRVRASQEDLAEDSGLSRRTVGKVIRGEAVRRYCDTVRSGRRLNLIWLDMGTNMGTNMGTEFPPSASASTTSRGRDLHGVSVDPMESGVDQRNNGSMEASQQEWDALSIEEKLARLEDQF